MKSTTPAFVTATSMLIGLGGCASYQPYIHPQKSGVASICGDASRTTSAEQLLCDSIEVVRKKRSELAVTQGLFATTLLPIAGIVGYRSARSLSATATIGWAAAGLTGYTAGQYLVQDSRFLIYDKGESAFGCLIGLHESWKSRAASNSSFVRVLGANSAFKSALAEAKLDSKNNSAKQQLADLESRANADVASAHLHAGGAADDGNLRQAVERVIGEVNTAMTVHGLLPLTGLASQFAAFQSFVPAQKSSTDSTTRADNPANALFNTSQNDSPSLIAARSAGSVLNEATNQWLSAPGAAATALPDYSRCTIGVVSAQATPPEQPLMLGANNAEDTQTRSMTAGAQLVIPVFGGRPPLAPAIIGNSASPPTVAVQQQGGAFILVVTTAQETTKAAYTVLLSDASGLWVRRLNLEVK